MNGNLIRKLSLLVLVTLLASMPATVVSASQPFFDSSHEEFIQLWGDCGGFEVSEDVVVDWDIKVFFDAAGEPVKVKSHGTWNGTFFNPVNGKSLVEDTQHFNVFEDVRSGNVTFAGLTMLITLPREGLVYHDSGRIIVTFDDVGNVDEIKFEAGPHPLFHGDLDAVCALLAD